jgi:hypothetical protein
MKIDRHNYEEFFLLYIDNELSVEEKKQVDEFVQANRDLAEELSLLMQARLDPAENIIFSNKEFLFKTAATYQGPDFEEDLILYLDNELTGEARRNFEVLLATEPVMRENFDMFSQSKLDPSDKIIFGDKKSLYRKEEKTPVIGLAWWRVAAAAILILAAGLSTYKIVINRSSLSSVAKIQEPIHVQQTPAPSNEIKNTPGNVAANERSSLPSNERNPDIAEVKKQDVIEVSHNKLSKDPAIIINPENKIIPVDALVNTQDKPTSTAVINTMQGTVSKTSTQDLSLSNAVNLHEKVLAKQIINEPVVTKIEDETLNNYASTSENKKLRGFFRKATRFIEHTTKINPANDDNKVLIGGMAINLK